MIYLAEANDAFLLGYDLSSRRNSIRVHAMIHSRYAMLLPWHACLVCCHASSSLALSTAWPCHCDNLLLMGQEPGQTARDWVLLQGPEQLIPPHMEVAHIRYVRGAPYPGIFLYTAPARMVRPVAHIGLRSQELIGSLEQAFLSIRYSTRSHTLSLRLLVTMHSRRQPGSSRTRPGPGTPKEISVACLAARSAKLPCIAYMTQDPAHWAAQALAPIRTASLATHEQHEMRQLQHYSAQ